MAYVSLTGLTGAITELLGLDAVEELEGRRLDPYRALGDKAAASHIITHRDGSVEATLKALQAANIVCASRNNRIRVSPAPYNDESDLHSLAGLLQRVPSR